MKYLLAIYGDESGQEDVSPDQAAASMQQWGEYSQKITEAGVFVAGEGLSPSATATTLRFSLAGDQVVTDGPFAETKEQLGGFYLLDCKDLDEALEWARKLPITQGAVEVRPVMDYEASGYERPGEAEVSS
jgi:hypothetical protein